MTESRTPNDILTAAMTRILDEAQSYLASPAASKVSFIANEADTALAEAASHTRLAALIGEVTELRQKFGLPPLMLGWVEVPNEPPPRTWCLISDDITRPQSARLAMRYTGRWCSKDGVFYDAIGFEPTHWCVVP